jgi:putative Mg2+ transporter-C (MgtC) family protein
MEGWWTLVVEDFSDFPTPAQAVRLAVRLILAAFLGGVLGYQRERWGKAAGLRTHMLVSLGSALFVVVPQQDGMALSDMSRVIQGLVTGIGFIGAGAILKQADQREIKGLTTSAGLWLTAAIGIAAGLGSEATAVMGTVLALFILSALGGVEKHVGGVAENSSENEKNSDDT